MSQETGRSPHGPSRRGFLAAAGGALALGSVAPTAAAATAEHPAYGHGHRGERWVGTWATVPTAVPEGSALVLEDRTVRQVVRTSVGGDRLRLRLSNEFGEGPLVVGEVRVALRRGSSGTDVRPGTDRGVTFSGRSGVTVPAGAPVVSDPVDLALPPLADLVVSMHLPERTEVTTLHAFAYQDNVIAEGDVTRAANVQPVATLGQWLFLSGVSVSTRGPYAGAVVALGDSITDGATTTTGANHRWPDLLAERLQAERGLRHLGVLNEGISGNRLLHDPNPPAGSPAEAYAAFFGQSALRRLDRDVLAQPGARTVIVLLGVNDLGHPGTSAPPSEEVTAGEIIGAHRQIVARAHERGLRVLIGTITPFEGDTLGFHSPEHEAARRKVNRWVRTSDEHDGVVDFDAAVRDPRHPTRLRPAYDSGDHLHPNDAGMRALARAVPLQLLR